MLNAKLWSLKDKLYGNSILTASEKKVKQKRGRQKDDDIDEDKLIIKSKSRKEKK